MKFLVDEGNFNTTVENIDDQDDLIDQVNAFNEKARAKNLQIISVHNLPRINIDQDRSTVIKPNAVFQLNEGAVAPNTQLYEINTAIMPDESDDTEPNQEDEHGFLLDNSIDTITSDDFDMILTGLKADASENSDQQIIADADIKPNSSDCDQFQDMRDETSDEQPIPNIQHTIEMLKKENGLEGAGNVDSKKEQKRKNISSSTEIDENQAKKQKLTESEAEDVPVAKKFKCKYCDCQFTKKYNLTAHKRKHRPYQCDICKTRFVEKTEIVAHMEEIHKTQVNLE